MDVSLYPWCQERLVQFDQIMALEMTVSPKQNENKQTQTWVSLSDPGRKSPNSGSNRIKPISPLLKAVDYDQTVM